MDRLRSRYNCVHQPPPASATADDRGFMTSLSVFEDREMNGPESRLPSSFSDPMVDLNTTDPHMIKEKITSVLNAIKFRDHNVLVQFWSPVAIRNQQLLTTSYQPFGLGVYDEKLYSYRLKSEMCAIVVDGTHIAKLGPQARVFSQKLPEWSLDALGMDTCYNIHGYIILPVFESSSDCCVGVLEIVTSSSYVDFAFEVHEVARALKNQNLKSSNMYEDPSFSIADERMRHEHDEIMKVLKTVCDNHNLPLAQTWALCASTSYVANLENLEQSCNSFNKSCIGNACISTINLPFYAKDLRMWEFHKACNERHLHKSQGVIGRSLSSCGTWFCEDVTQLDENNYPLVHNARMNRLTSCLAIYLQSQEDVERVIEIFLPSHTANELSIRCLMETIKQLLKNSSWMQLDIKSHPQVLGEVSFNWNFESPLSPNNLLTESRNMEVETSKSHAVSTSQSVVPYSDKEIGDSDASTLKTIRKRKLAHKSIGLNDISKHFGKTLDEAASILDVSRSTIKRVCRNLGITKWPNRKFPDKRNADVVTSEGSLTRNQVPNEPFNGTTYINHDHTEDVLQKQEQANLPEEIVQPETANVTINERFIEGFELFKGLVATQIHHEIGSFRLKYRDENGDQILITFENDLMGSSIKFKAIQPNTPIRRKFCKIEDCVTVKAKYGNNTVTFTYRLLDGLERLNELIATLFQLEIGSFRLKYLDEDGDKILIVCENDLMVPNDPIRTKIKLFVELN